MESRWVCVDGNEAAAWVAYRTNEVAAIYPITPSSPMGELADAWSSAGRRNLWGGVPEVVEMQSEGGAAGAVHGALQAGALATTFTASQGLLLMLPNMFKIAGELSPAVIHVAARTLATHALSIFGDHSDVMAARTTGWAMLASGSVQEAQDLAAVAQAATLASRVPFVHFFDGFRTSHEVAKIERLSIDDLDSLLDRGDVEQHRLRALDPDRPVLRGSAQNPDVFFQAREAANPYYLAVPRIVTDVMERLERRTGRRYRPFEYVGDGQAERVLVLMGSGSGPAEEAIAAARARGEKVGLVRVRLYRPFCAESFAAALPESVRRIAVLDRTKEPGAVGEPLYQDVVTSLAERGRSVEVIGGRYGLSSKEFTPSMAAAVLAELDETEPRRHFTVGIVDDVTHTSLRWDPESVPEEPDVTRAVFFGLGSDGTVGASKNTVKIIGESTPSYAQGYFVYDSKKAGSVTVAHVRVSPRPIRSAYLVRRADFVACHQFHLLDRHEVLEVADERATLLVNSPWGPDEVWDHLSSEVQQVIIDKKLRLFVIDAAAVARACDLGNRINTVMQTCFFALTDLLPLDEARARLKSAIDRTYGRRGAVVVERNHAAVDAAVDALHAVEPPEVATSSRRRPPIVPTSAPEFVQRVTALIIAGQGNLLPVSALPVDGTFPTGTARFEKRSIAEEIPIWDPDLCIQCGLCSLVCPHAAIRTARLGPEALPVAPPLLSRPSRDREHPDHRFVLQVAPDDCTGCGVCVDVCPARSKEVSRHKAIDMEDKGPHLEVERERFERFTELPPVDREAVKLDSVAGSQFLEPLFEFSGACAGCGETPYLKLISQLFGDRMLIANATGCSSIYGGNLPTTPWATDPSGRGPAWSNSLFEDNAEFGLGLRLAIDQQRTLALELLGRLQPRLGERRVASLREAPGAGEAAVAARRAAVEELRAALGEIDGDDARRLEAASQSLLRRSVWIVGGDGWAYDIGFGGLDHVLASGRDVNVIVLDTEVYSNTGGQTSKSTPRSAVAKFSAAGKGARKKDLGRIAMAYGDVYVAQVAIGAHPKQTLQVLLEAESYPGPSLVIAYSTCIAHGIDMSRSMSHQKLVVSSGHVPLYRHDPRRTDRPFVLDSRRPNMSFAEFARQEARFAMLAHAAPERAEALWQEAQRDVDERWRAYEQMAGRKPPEESP